MFTARQTVILRSLLSTQEYTSYAGLAQRLSISSRTLMREMDALKPDLKKAGLSVMTKKGAGFMLAGSEADRKALLASLDGHAPVTQNRRERRMLLGAELLNNRNSEKLLYYADRYEVSEATISNDLDVLEKELAPFHITLQRKPGYGIEVLADEAARRQGLSWLSNQMLAISAAAGGFDRYNVRDLMNSLTSNAASSMNQVLDMDILEVILDVLFENEEELQLSAMAMASYTGLIIHLVIMTDRLRRHMSLEQTGNMPEWVHDEASLAKARRICSLLAERFDLDMQPSEEYFIAIHLQSAKSFEASEDAMDEYLDLIYAMLLEFRKAGWNLFSDQELLSSLSAHLPPAIARMKAGLPVSNPLLQEIQKQFPEVYGMSILAGQAITARTGLEMSPDEAGYLTLHFAAALERARTRAFGKVRVAVVCATGIGLSSLLCARLRQLADSQVEINAMSVEQARQKEADIIVSTFDLPGALVVHPILVKEDEEAFLKKLSDVRSSGRQAPAASSAEMDIGRLISSLRNLIEDLQLIKYDQPQSKEQLIGLMAAQAAGENHELAASLKQALLKREELSSNLYPELELALFHTAVPELEKPVLILARPEENKAWSGELQDITLAVMMAMPKPAGMWQQDMLSNFSAMLIEEPEFFKALCTEEEDAIRQTAQRYYQKWLSARIRSIHF